MRCWRAAASGEAVTIAARRVVSTASDDADPYIDCPGRGGDVTIEAHRMWTSSKLMGDWPVKELCPYVALSSDASTAYIHQERAIFALSVGTPPPPRRRKERRATKSEGDEFKVVG